MFVRPVLLGLVLPAAALFAAAFAWRRREREGAGLVLSLLLAALFFLAAAAWNGWPPFPPVTTTQQLGYAVLGAAAVALLAGRLSVRAVWTLRFGYLCAVLGWAGWPKVGHAWPPGFAPVVVAVWAAVLVGAWRLAESRTLRRGEIGPVSFYAPFALAVGGTAPVLFLGGSALLAQWAASLAVLAAAAGAGLACRKGEETTSVLGAALPAFGLLLANAVWYSSLPAASALFLVLAVAAPAAADRFLPRVLTRLWRTAWGLAAAGACVALAAAICWAVIRPSLSEY